jgi:hypothetical protein
MDKSQNPTNEYSFNFGLNWLNDEESLLIKELYTDIDIETIAQHHCRTIEDINSKRHEIAYKMYLNKSSIKEIFIQTKLDEECIKQIIEQRNINPQPIKEKLIERAQYRKCKNIPANVKVSMKIKGVIENTSTNKDNNSINNQLTLIKSDIKGMKKDIKEIKKTVNDIFEMMRSFYEMKDASQEL